MREKKLVERVVKVTAFMIPKNGCQGPAKPKGVAHLDIDYRSKKDSQSVKRTIKSEDSVYQRGL